MKVTELKKRCKEYTAELVQAVKEAKNDKKLLEYFDFCSRFHNYSFGNRLLIWAHKPSATFVAGFKAWQKMGRFIKKGERGIPIFAPMTIKVKKEDSRHLESEISSIDPPDKHFTDPLFKSEGIEIITRFKVVYVWDVSQTEGDPLPTVPDTLAVNGDATSLLPALEKVVENHEIVLSYVEEIYGDAIGVSKHGEIQILSSLEMAQRFSVLVHEFAHELLHGPWKRAGGLSAKMKELEAEATAFVVSKYFSLQTKAPTYLALYRVEEVDIMHSLDRIVRTASEIIRAVENHIGGTEKQE